MRQPITFFEAHYLGYLFLYATHKEMSFLPVLVALALLAVSEWIPCGALWPRTKTTVPS